MKNFNKIGLFITMFTIPMVMSTNSFAEDEKEKDKTGTNPVNFSKDLRVYNEYSWLNTEGDGTQNVTTVDFKMPFADGKWQWRVRAKFNALTADFNNDGIDEVDESGTGDVDMRFLTVPIVNMAEKEAWAFGLEVFLNTASEDALGSGTTALGPQAFYVKFLERGLFAPAIQYKFSVDEDSGRSEVDQILLDFNYLLMAEDKQSWFFTDPQIIIDNETDEEFSIVDFEFGWMMTKWWPDMKGQSVYIRPSIGVGTDRPVDGSIEIGYKLVGF